MNREALRRQAIDLFLKGAGHAFTLWAVGRGSSLGARMGHLLFMQTSNAVEGVGLASTADFVRVEMEVGRLADRVGELTASVDRLEAAVRTLGEHQPSSRQTASDQAALDHAATEYTAR